MKRILAILLSVMMVMTGSITFSFADTAAADPEKGDRANSWRYSDGQLIESAPAKARAAASHQDATLDGIDVSVHQGEIDWEKVQKAGIDFAIIRCGYGMDGIPEQDDEYFERNASECERLGIPYGVYLYSYADSTSRASSEADHVLRMIKGHNLSYPVFYDIEDNSVLQGRTQAQNQKLMASIAKTFCNKIEAAGYPVGVYANLNWWNNYLTDPVFENWHRWVAQYNSSCNYTGNYGIWQYTSSGSVNGISGRVDMNFQIGWPEDHGFLLETDKTSYDVGEDIKVRASAATDSSWVGLYKKGDVHGSGKTPSINWYYVKDFTNGEYVVIQDALEEGPVTLEAGDYELRLFKDSGYEMIKSVEIKIEPAGLSDSLKSIEYDLDNETDGLANGTVTVKTDADSKGLDCIMFWADKDGKPLEEYTALPKFKITGEVTEIEMYDYTIIPEGAEKLVAYLSSGDLMSEDYVSADLPEGSTYKLTYDYKVEFQMLSDIHITEDGAGGDVRLANTHFMQMLSDVKANSPESIGIFVNGDIADSGHKNEYEKMYSMYTEAAAGGSLPEIHMSIGNHDWMQGNPDGQFQKYAAKFNTSLTKQPEKVYYDEEVGGYHFIYLGGESSGTYASLSAAQLEWLEGRLAEITKENPRKPVFILLHQPLENTVAGTLPGQGWHGVNDEQALKDILKKYDQAIIFGGHSHWELESEMNMYPADETMCTAVNTASLGYLWSSYNRIDGEFEEGSQGYYVRVYDDKVVFLGREFEQSKWVPSGMFVVQLKECTHKLSDWEQTKEVSCTSDGEMKRTCKYCDYFITKTVEAKGHKYDAGVVTKEPGIGEKGVKTFTCTECGDKYTEDIAALDAASVERIYGANRYETAFKAADALKEQLGTEKFGTIIVASGSTFADALPGSYLAAKKDAPILLINASQAEAVRIYIENNLASGGKVYVLGGKNAIPDAWMKGIGFERIGGNDRYETNLKILEAAGLDKNAEFMVCTGTNFADSLSVSATGKPILLVGKSLKAGQKEYLEDLAGETYCVIGGTSAVSSAVQNQFTNYGATYRVAGENRYETSVKVAENFFDKPQAAVLAYAQNFPDGLSAGPLAYNMKAPLLLTKTGKEKTASAYTNKLYIRTGAVLGGPTLISDDAVKAVFSMSEADEIVIK